MDEELIKEKSNLKYLLSLMWSVKTSEEAFQVENLIANKFDDLSAEITRLHSELADLRVYAKDAHAFIKHMTALGVFRGSEHIKAEVLGLIDEYNRLPDEEGK